MAGPAGRLTSDAGARVPARWSRHARLQPRRSRRATPRMQLGEAASRRLPVAHQGTRWPGRDSRSNNWRHAMRARRSGHSAPCRRAQHRGRSRPSARGPPVLHLRPNRRQSAPAPASPGRAGPGVGIFAAERASTEPFVRALTKHLAGTRVEVSSAARLVQRKFAENCGRSAPSGGGSGI